MSPSLPGIAPRSLEIGDDLTQTRAYGTVKTASVNTNEPGRDEHLRSADFFDVENYLEIRFESTSIEAIDDDALKILGNLTIKHTTNEVELLAEVASTEVNHGATTASAWRPSARSRAATSGSRSAWRSAAATWSSPTRSR